MLIREEQQVALDKVAVLALKNSDHYESEAERVSPDLALFFRSLAARRKTFAGQLAEILRRTGELPSEPDRDREVVEEVITRLRTFLASDREAELLQEREKGESELAEAVEQALQFRLPRETVDLLHGFSRHIEETRTRLQQYRGRS
ncbi:MAG: DUF2383 domain-containing protein [Desulfobulbaceae bacterium]|nr:DUF2383 domain-containing protein [Desulfobulbaceae bacterium]